MPTPTPTKRGKKPTETAADEGPPYIVGRPGMLLRLNPRKSDPEAVRLMFGDGLLTLEGIALEFGVTLDEVQEWIKQGMPGPVSADGAHYDSAPPVNDFNPPNRRVCELLRRLQIKEFYVFEIALLLGGDVLVDTQAEVAKAFGVGLDTAKGWFAMGAPKPPKGKPYNLIGIVAWRVRADVLGAER